jgi:putative transposase
LSVSNTAALYRRYRFPGEIISYAVWLYYRFTLSYRDIEVLLAERGVQVTYESIRQWCRKFGPTFAAGLRQRRPAARPKWHLDEVFIRIRKQTYYLWRAVDQDGMVLDILVQERRNQEAAERFLRRVVAGEPRGAAGGRDGQAGQLPAGDPRGLAADGAPQPQGAEQSGRALAPADAAAGAADATLQIPGAGAALSGTIRPNQRPLLPAAAPARGDWLPTRAGAAVPDLARNHEQRRLTALAARACRSCRTCL